MDPYLILGVAENATLDEIRKAYRRLAIQLHPDAGGNLDDFKRLQEAYEELSQLAANQSGSSEKGAASSEEPLDVEIFDQVAPETAPASEVDKERSSRARPKREIDSRKWSKLTGLVIAACMGLGLLAYWIWPKVQLELAIQQGRWSDAIQLAPRDQRALLGYIGKLLIDPECNIDDLFAKLEDLRKLNPPVAEIEMLHQQAILHRGLTRLRDQDLELAIHDLRLIADQASGSPQVWKLAREIASHMESQLAHCLATQSTDETFQEWTRHQRIIEGLDIPLQAAHSLLKDSLQKRAGELARNGKLVELLACQEKLKQVLRELRIEPTAELSSMSLLCEAIQHASQGEIDAAIGCFREASKQPSDPKLAEAAKQTIMAAINYRIEAAVKNGNEVLANQEIERGLAWHPESTIPSQLLLYPLERSLERFKKEASVIAREEVDVRLRKLPSSVKETERFKEYRNAFTDTILEKLMPQHLEAKQFRESVQDLECIAGIDPLPQHLATGFKRLQDAAANQASLLGKSGRHFQLAEFYASFSSLRDNQKKLIEQALQTAPPMINSLGMKFSLMPPSTGNPHLLIGTCEVTQEQYQALGLGNPSKHKGGPFPVENISLRMAQLFCKRLSELPAERHLMRTYRLPTATEWELASRAGASTPFHFGTTNDPVENFAWIAENSKNETHAVGRLGKNAWGLHDMIGNVWEFDAAGAFHGFCFHISKKELVAGRMHDNGKKYTAPDVGFRVVVEASPMIPVLKLSGPMKSATSMWRYTLESPSSKWFSSDFSDQGWALGNSAFGSRKTGKSPSRIPVHTEWKSETIWLRNKFQLDAIPRLAKFVIANPDKLTIILNGAPIVKRNANSEGKYVDEPLSQEQLQKLVVGENTIAVEGEHKSGQRYLDVGLIIQY